MSIRIGKTNAGKKKSNRGRGVRLQHANLIGSPSACPMLGQFTEKRLDRSKCLCPLQKQQQRRSSSNT